VKSATTITMFFIFSSCFQFEEVIDEVTVVDLLGTWEASYEGQVLFDESIRDSVNRSGVETLILRPDGQYEHAFNDGRGFVYESALQRWEIGRNSNDRQIVRLSNMRYFPSGIHNSDFKSVTLQVGKSSFDPLGLTSSELILCHNIVDHSLCFVRVDSKK